MSEYKSPIEIIYEQVRYEMDNEIMRAIQGVGINVDKDELIKALAYDRDQYQKGFQDGKACIVYCKECKYRGEYFSCLIPYRTDDDFFCKNGERKTE